MLPSFGESPARTRLSAIVARRIRGRSHDVAWRHGPRRGPRTTCHATSQLDGADPGPLSEPTLPGDVATTPRCTVPPRTATAASIVEPVVATSSTRTHPGCGSQRGRHLGATRNSGALPAWRGHHHAGERAVTTGRPVCFATTTARATAGSTPLRHRRRRARGRGTSAVACAGTTSAITDPRIPAASGEPVYLS